jgi:Protein of unknown function (DUF3540)
MTALRELKLDALALSHTEAAFAAMVERAEAGNFLLRHGTELRAAGVALGCVYWPEPGDEVLALPLKDKIWILSLLSRPGDAPLRLLAPQGLTIEVQGELTVRAPKARLLIAEIFHAGLNVISQLARLDLTAGLLRTVARQVVLHAGSSLRQIETLDQVKAGGIEQRAETSLQLAAENAFITADNLLRVDAEQVHIG